MRAPVTAVSAKWRMAMIEASDACQRRAKDGWFRWRRAILFLAVMVPHQPSHAGPHSGLSRS